MIFHIDIIKNNSTHNRVDIKLPVGACIRGLQYSGVRPQSITITGAEFKELMQESNRHYIATQLLPSFDLDSTTKEN